MKLHGARAAAAGLCLSFGLASCATGISDSKSAQLYYDLGNAYSQLGDQTRATAAYLNALKLDRTLKAASYNLARVYIEAGKFQDALSILNSVLAADPTNIIALDTVGYAYYKSGDKQKALTAYEKVLKLSPLDSNALYNRGIILADLGENQEALNSLNKLYDENRDATILLPIGRIEAALGDNKAAATSIEAYLAAKPDDFDAASLLASIYRKEELYDKAIKAYDAALKLKPGTASLLFAKAEILLTAIQDAQAGMLALQAAIDAGFSDRSALARLVANPELVNKQEVERYLNEKELLSPQKTGATTSAPSQSKTQGGTSPEGSGVQPAVP
ncbi:MAG TPA: tetratricopeptide repeat protein [Spirochaetia bacterium]|nr:tetratricopeptide repeat protein [Spirochaetia bacterium]